MKHVHSIKKLVRENENFRKILFTGKQTQVALMNLAPGDEIGEEVHPDTDQLFIIEEGRGELRLEGKASPVEEHEVAFVPAGMRHNFRNPGKRPLKLYTIYAPPVHAPDAVQKVAHKLVEHT